MTNSKHYNHWAFCPTVLVYILYIYICIYIILWYIYYAIFEMQNKVFQCYQGTCSFSFLLKRTHWKCFELCWLISSSKLYSVMSCFQGKIVKKKVKVMLWWPIKAELFLSKILISKVNFTFTFSFKSNLNLNSISF